MLALFCASGFTWAAQNYGSTALYGSKKAFTTGNSKVRHTGEAKRPRTVDVIKYSTSAKSAGGPDSLGYTFKDSNEPGGPAFNWVEISGSGTNMALSDDSYYYSIPFIFTFYGTTYNNIAIGSNGTVYFQDSYLGYNYTTIPSTNGYGIDIFMAPYWTDLNPGASGAVYYQVIGSTLVVEWYQVPIYGTSDYLTFQVILNNSDNTIKFQYLDLADPGYYACTGIQGSSTEPPLWGLQYMYEAGTLSNNLAIQFEQYIPTSHDVKVASIDTPATVMTPTVAFNPAATIKNPGLSPESDFQIFFQINDSLGAQLYLDSAMIASPDSIMPDSFRQFAFANTFTPAQWTKYTAVAWTGLADDYSWNDTLRKPFRTWDLDVSTTAILNPLGSANPDPDIIPRVVFHNAATQTADFNATFQARYGGSLMYNATISIAGLAGGADTTVVFPVWPGVRLEGTYDITAYAAMAQDLDKANDTITGAFLSGYNIWQTWTPLSEAATAAAEAGYQGKLYMFGGFYNFSGPVDNIAIYDTATASWSTSAAVLSSASYFNSAVAARGKIFVMGGDGSGIVSNLDCYSPDGDSLNPRTAMPSAGYGFVTAAWRDTIIFRFGGYDASYNPMATVVLYDVVNDAWATSPTPLPLALGFAGGTILGDTIVISTGYNPGVGLTDITYIGIIDPANPGNIAWSAGASYPGGAIYGSANGYVSNAAGHKLLIAGGYNDFGTVIGSTYTYSTADGWIQMPDKTTPVYYTSGSQVGDYFVVAGGYDGWNFLTCNEALYLGSSEAAQPVITATSPEDGVMDVNVASPVVITFSKSMDTTAVIYSCIPDPGNMTAAWNYDYTIMTVSHDSFAYSTAYSFMVTAGQSLDGYALKTGSVPDSFGFGTVISGVSGQPVTAGVPYFMASAAPNPMGSGQTTIAFGLPRSSQVRIEVYNIAGQRVKTLVNGNMNAGYHKVAWNGRNQAGQKVANGVYMYRMNSGDYTATKKLLIVK
jgi:hypothetical protein